MADQAATTTATATYSALLGLSAPDVGWTPPLRYLLRRQRILRLSAQYAPGRLLEVGCGAGALLADFSRQGFEATGLETSPAALAMSRELARLDGAGPCVVPRAGEDWAEAFDVLCSFDVLEHIEHDAQALAQWTGWLRPGGTVLLSVPAHPARWNAGDEWAGHWRRYSRAMLLDLLHACGLQVEYLECYGFPLANLTERVGERTYRRMIGQRQNLSREEATAHSGTDRRAYSRLSRAIASPIGRLALRCAMVAQGATGRTDWGSGYLVVARKP